MGSVSKTVHMQGMRKDTNQKLQQRRSGSDTDKEKVDCQEGQVLLQTMFVAGSVQNRRRHHMTYHQALWLIEIMNVVLIIAVFVGWNFLKPTPVVVIQSGALDDVYGLSKFEVIDLDDLHVGRCPKCGGQLDMDVDNQCTPCRIDWDNWSPG